MPRHLDEQLRAPDHSRPLPVSADTVTADGAPEQKTSENAVHATQYEMLLAATCGIAAFAGLFFVQPMAAVAAAYLVFTMALITFVDRRHFIIPDVLSLPAIPLGLVANLALTEPAFWNESIMDGLAAAGLAAGALMAVRAAYWRIRGIEGLGLGDVKLAAVAGAWTGLDGLATTSLIACIAALAAVGIRSIRQRSTAPDPMSAVPFGSFIAPAIVIMWLWQALSGA